MKLNKNLVRKISKPGNEIGTIEILDYVIAIQLDKIENIHMEFEGQISDNSEKAMENMIKLLELRYNRKGY